MSGVEILGALSAILSGLKASTQIIEIIEERREFEHHINRALDLAELLQWQWTGLSHYLDAAQQEGLDDGLLAEHAKKMDHKLLEAFDLVRDLQNRDRMVNIRVLLGLGGTGKLKKLNASLDYLVRRHQALEGVFLRWITTDTRRRISRSSSLPLPSSYDCPLGSPLSTARTAADLESISESLPPLDTISRSSTLPLSHNDSPQRSPTTSISSVAKSVRPASLVFPSDVISEKQAKELLASGLQKLENPNVQISGPKGESLLHWLIKRCKDEAIRYLISQPGIDINAVDSANLTPLYHAVNMLSPNKVEIVKAMVKRGAKFGVMKPKLTGNRTKEISHILQKMRCV